MDKKAFLRAHILNSEKSQAVLEKGNNPSSNTAWCSLVDWSLSPRIEMVPLSANLCQYSVNPVGIDCIASSVISALKCLMVVLHMH
jgi:hypothetical protein